MKKYKNFILSLSLKKIYSYFFLNNYKKNSYFNHLKELYFQFLSSKYPDLKKDNFEKNLNYLINFEEDDLTTHFHEIFEPDYNKNLDNFYKLHEKQIFLRFLKYSLNEKLIAKKYSNAYHFSINKINEPLEILEVGGGVPHGLIYNIWKHGKEFCKKLTYVEADMLHTEFVAWYCKHNSIPLEKKIFLGAKTPTIDKSKFNFVFAKDIFEHLENPEKLIDELIFSIDNPKTLLCLDLEHKGAITVDHISPNLPILKDKLLKNNFRVIKKFDEIDIWEKVI